MKKFKYVDDNPGSYFGMLIESVEDKKELKEDKFVPQDKMSKKAQKELNDKKRGTWGNTSPVTRVQPNKKAYDRKRDSKVVDESKKLNESSDGWDEDKLSDLRYILDKLANLQYEINNCVKGAYSRCTSYSELGDYIRDLGSELMDIADDVSEYVEEDDEEDED